MSKYDFTDIDLSESTKLGLDHETYGEPIRAIELGSHEVYLFDTGRVDHYGKTGLHVEVWNNDGEMEYETEPDGLVYCSPMQGIDSDESVASCIGLICHANCVAEDCEDGEEPGWVEELSNALAMAEVED